MGFRYCLLHTFYDYQISLKLEELRDPNSPMSQKFKDMSACRGQSSGPAGDGDRVHERPIKR
jgi:hypothetical protein